MPTQVNFPDGSHATIKYVGHDSNGDEVYRIKECICEGSVYTSYGICQDCGLEVAGAMKNITSINRKERQT